MVVIVIEGDTIQTTDSATAPGDVTITYLTGAARRQQPDAKTVPVKLVVGPTDGYSPIDDAYGWAARFVLTRFAFE